MPKLKSKILVVDDNAGIRSALKILLPMRFAEVELIASPKVLMETMRTFKPDVVLLDMNFETDINTGNEGLFWLSELKRDFPEVEVVLFTAYLRRHRPRRGRHETRCLRLRGEALGQCQTARHTRRGLQETS